MIQFRWRQKWYKATCVCDKGEGYYDLLQRHGRDRQTALIEPMPVKILYIPCDLCNHLHSIDMVQEFGSGGGPQASSIYIYPQPAGIRRIKNSRGREIILS